MTEEEKHLCILIAQSMAMSHQRDVAVKKANEILG